MNQPGPITVRVRYTAFWSVTTGEACLGPGPDGWTSIDALTGGVVQLSASVLHPSQPAVCPSH